MNRFRRCGDLLNRKVTLRTSSANCRDYSAYGLHWEIGVRVANDHSRVWYSTPMPNYHWDDEKDALLRRTRGVSFIEITYAIEHGGLLDTIDHPNPVLHPGQRIFIVQIDDYAYRVPFETTSAGYFLRTIYPSGDDTRYYLR